MNADTGWDTGSGGVRDAAPPPIAERLAAWLMPAAFLASVAAGFALSAALGWLSIDRAMFVDFRRFHQLISSESFFNPTALQVRHMVDEIPADKIVVIVGGTSRFNGVGQTPDGLWSGVLQELLGPRYHVINLALRAGRIDQFGSHAAEMLLREGRQVILVGDLHVTEIFHPLGGYPLFHYFTHDAAARGMLFDWPPRTAAVAALSRSEAQQGAIAEGRLRARLNVAFNFDELWTYVAYRYGSFAGWYQVLGYRRPFAPRSGFPDPERTVPAAGYYAYFPVEKELANLRHFGQNLPEAHWSVLRNSLDVVPDPVRSHLIVVAVRFSPYYAVHLVAAERAGLDRNYRRFIDTIEGAGVRAIDVGDGWSSSDYVDGLHVSEAGGRRLADAVAPAVRRLASDLGYDR